MIAPLAKLLDWSAIQAVSVMMQSDSMQHPRLEEALEFLEGPEFIPDESQPARLEFEPRESGRHFRFPSPRPGNRAENNIVYGRLHHFGERWQERPVVIRQANPIKQRVLTNSPQMDTKVHEVGTASPSELIAVFQLRYLCALLFNRLSFSRSSGRHPC